MLSSIHASLQQMQTAQAQLADVLPSGAAQGPSFTQHVGGLLRGADDKGHAAQAAVSAVESGRSDDLVGAMLKSQEASLNFNMMMQVRNKVVGAFDELMKLPI
jgi:flagellar hook-basal body complex protein FliE